MLPDVFDSTERAQIIWDCYYCVSQKYKTVKSIKPLTDLIKKEYSEKM